MIKTEISTPVKNKSTFNEKENMCKFTTPKTVQNGKDTTFEKPSSSISELKFTSAFSDDKRNVTDKQERKKQVIPNLACEWSTKKTICSRNMLVKGAVSKSIPTTPEAYLAKDIIKRKREEAVRRILEEEKKPREFHARPVPEFIYEPVPKFQSLHCVTVPVTPEVLKKSLASAEKRKKRLEEMEQKLQPKKKSPCVNRQCPFNLCTEKRLQERIDYSKIARKAIEEKQKQEQENCQRLERKLIKELRKAATFKANPNPFKK